MGCACIRTNQAAPKGKSFEVEAHILRLLCAEHTIPMQFRRCNVRRLCCQLSRVINKIPSLCDADAIWVLLLGPVVNDHICIVSDRPVGWDIRFVLRVHDEHCVCTNLSRFIVPLGHPTKIIPKRCHPSFLGDRVFHQFFVTRDGFVCDRVDHWHCIMQIIPLMYWLWLQREGSKLRQIVVSVVHEEKVDSLLAYYS